MSEPQRVEARRPARGAAFWITLARSILALALGLALIIHPDKARPILVNFVGVFWLTAGVMSLRWGASGERGRMATSVRPKAARTSGSAPLYVLRLDPARNAVVVGAAEELGERVARTRLMHYVSGEAPSEPLRCTAKIRYKAREAAGWLKPLPGGGAEFEFDELQRDVTPGQGLVCYLGDEVVGGRVIAR